MSEDTLYTRVDGFNKDGISIFHNQQYGNKTNHPISSNNHPSATENIAIHCPKEGGYKLETIFCCNKIKHFLTREHLVNDG